MSQEIYTKGEHYQDWKNDNLDWLKDLFIKGAESIVIWWEDKLKGDDRNRIMNGGRWTGTPKERTSKLESYYIEEHADDFEAYCRQQFKDK